MPLSSVKPQRVHLLSKVLAPFSHSMNPAKGSRRLSIPFRCSSGASKPGRTCRQGFQNAVEAALIFSRNPQVE